MGHNLNLVVSLLDQVTQLLDESIFLNKFYLHHLSLLLQVIDPLCHRCLVGQFGLFQILMVTLQLFELEHRFLHLRLAHLFRRLLLFCHLVAQPSLLLRLLLDEPFFFFLLLSDFLVKSRYLAFKILHFFLKRLDPLILKDEVAVLRARPNQDILIIVCISHLS